MSMNAADWIVERLGYDEPLTIRHTVCGQPELQHEYELTLKQIMHRCLEHVCSGADNR